MMCTCLKHGGLFWKSVDPRSVALALRLTIPWFVICELIRIVVCPKFRKHKLALRRYCKSLGRSQEVWCMPAFEHRCRQLQFRMVGTLAQVVLLTFADCSQQVCIYDATRCRGVNLACVCWRSCHVGVAPMYWFTSYILRVPVQNYLVLLTCSIQFDHCCSWSTFSPDRRSRMAIPHDITRQDIKSVIRAARVLFIRSHQPSGLQSNIRRKGKIGEYTF